MKNLIRDALLFVVNRLVSNIPSNRVRLFFYRLLMRYEIGPNTTILSGLKVSKFKLLSIGHNTVINANCELDARGGIAIGDNVSISGGVVVVSADHDMNSPDFAYRERRVVISDYVWIGTRATILPGVTIARGAVVAAGAVVARDVAENSVVGGVPAKVIGTRSQDALRYELSFHQFFQ